MNSILDLIHSANSAPSAVKEHLMAPHDPDELASALDHLELQAEYAQTLGKHSSNVFLKAAMNIAAMHFFDVLNRFDTVTLTKRLKGKPEIYFQMMNSYANLMRANLEREKFEFRQKQAEARQRARDQKLRNRKPMLLTEDTLNAFNRVTGMLRQLTTADEQLTSHNTANTGVTETVDVLPGDLAQLTTEDRQPMTQNPERAPEPSWSDAPSEELLCCVP